MSTSTRGACIALTLLALCGVALVQRNPPAPEQLAVGYPPGPWWRAADELNDVVLSGAHILVAHRDSVSGGPVQYMRWSRQARSRAEALELARSLRDSLVADPASFEALARARSDDLATAPMGGDLGVFRANRVDPTLLNALGHIDIGELSRVVETRAGFHVLVRRSVPEPQLLSARQLVVKHRDAVGRIARTASAEAAGSRSRERARAMAEALRERALESPDDFAALARAHSESYEAAQGGDIGAYSTHDPSADPLTFAAVARLGIGQIGDVMDTPLGYAVLMRTDETRRQQLAAQQIIVGHSETPSPARLRELGRSREQAAAKAQALHARLASHPQRFEALRQEHCDVTWCQDSRAQWSQGRANPDVDAAVRTTPVGALVANVIESELGYHIIRRQAPSTPEPSASLGARRELPRPPMPPLLEFVAQVEPSRLQVYTRVLHAHLGAELGLSREEHEALGSILESVILQFQQQPQTQWPQLVRQGQQEIEALLGPRRSGRLTAMVDAWYRRQMLGG